MQIHLRFLMRSRITDENTLNEFEPVVNGAPALNRLCESNRMFFEARYPQLRALVEKAGVQCPAPANCTVYADSRLMSFFPREDMTVTLPEELFDVFTGETYAQGTPLRIPGKLGRAFARNPI